MTRGSTWVPLAVALSLVTACGTDSHVLAMRTGTDASLGGAPGSSGGTSSTGGPTGGSSGSSGGTSGGASGGSAGASTGDSGGAPQTCEAGACGPPTHNCGMQLNESPVAFCETFDRPEPVGNRSGEMNGDLWGVQRIGGIVNYGQPFTWANAQVDLCGTDVAVHAETDLRICNGQLRDGTNDNLSGNFEEGGPIALTMYAKQPFDFAGRTGTVSFDVSNNSFGTHAVWPEFWVTDQPVPAPWIHFGSFISHPRNGLAIRLGNAASDAGNNQGECPTNANLDKWRWTVDSAAIVRDFVMEDTASEGDPDCLGAETCFHGNLKVNLLDCVIEPKGPEDGFNHVEVKINQTQIDVYATDAGTTTPLKHIASITGVDLAPSFTRGVIWIDDAHYNADKGPTGYPSERVHTFAWDNVAFDGPLLRRDLSFDVLDSMAPIDPNSGIGTNGAFLGWDSSATAPASVTTLPMTADQIAAASGALLLFNFWVRDPDSYTIAYSVNGHAHTYAWPYPDTQGNTPRTLAIPVDLGELVAGPNAVTLGLVNTPAEWAHVNIALLEAGGIVAPPTGYP